MTASVPREYNAADHFVDRHVREGRGARVAFVDDATSITYAALADRVSRVANLLVELGVEPEQRVALCMLDSVDFPCVFWGAIKAGMVPVPLNTLLTTHDYELMLRDSRARVLVVSDALHDKIAPAAAASPTLSRVVSTSELPGLLENSSPRREPAPTCADDAAFWLYSSGS